MIMNLIVESSWLDVPLFDSSKKVVSCMHLMCFLGCELQLDLASCQIFVRNKLEFLNS